MSFFACFVHSRGERVAPATTEDVERFWAERGVRLDRLECGAVTVLRSRDDTSGVVDVAASGSLVAAGWMRLENRDVLARRYGLTDEPMSAVALALRHYCQTGEGAIRDLIGDFALVIADGRSGTALAARDAFGVRTLYTAQRGDVTVFATRAEAIASGDDYDTDYLIEFAAGVESEAGRAAYAGVRSVPPASMAVVRGGLMEVRTYWSAAEFEPTPVRDEAAAVEEFRSRLFDAVRLCLTGDAGTWSELSGGLDSSSIVSIAQTLERRGEVATGVGGTLTYVDSVGAGSDERIYSDSVVQTYGVRNELFVDYVPLQGTSQPVPNCDLPSARCLLAARDVATCALLGDADARVLLSGVGSDHYLVGSMFFFADWIATGQLQRALREMLRWAALGRVSFWKLAYLNAVLPLVPSAFRLRRARGVEAPLWIPARARQRLRLTERSVVAQSYAGRRGAQYAHELAFSTSGISAAIDHGIVADAVDVRYPFCHRPLVELALALPAEVSRRPNVRKWILREAMRGCLPEIIRQRRWKGAFDGRIAWSLMHERHRFDALVEHSVLAELGCIEIAPLCAAIEKATTVDGEIERGQVLNVLALELWLRMRTGKWDRAE
ncbi:MAG TPA: asparagine synthase-related protein [Gemmatimonadaceae bacterium]|nr:asparagine synthase-related protein [Gemmatimonadaceae bacterium]